MSLNNTEFILNNTITINQQDLSIRHIDQGDGLPLLYLHGWGATLFSFASFSNTIIGERRKLILDFPGFGESSHPNDDWGTYHYADFVQQWLKQKEIESAVVIGHSFGGRVAIQLASHWPETVKGLVLIASAGLKRTVPLKRKLRVKTIQCLAKTAKRIIPGSLGESMKQSLYRRIASPDYLNAGPMRAIFVNVVNEDLAELIPTIKAPSLLLWGSDDTETPPEFGQRMNQLLPNSNYVELPGFDHYSILERGRYQVAHHLNQFLNQVD